MTTKGGGNKGREETWDNGEYKKKRRETFKLLHRYRKNRDWGNKLAYLESRKELADLRDKLINDWLDEKQKQVAASRNITEWWKAMSWYRKKRKIVSNTIIGDRLNRKRGKLYAVFVDFKKAFDMVDRKRLWEKWRGWE